MMTNKLKFFENVFLIGEIAGIIGTTLVMLIHIIGLSLGWNIFIASIIAVVLYAIVVILINRIAKYILFKNRKSDDRKL